MDQFTFIESLPFALSSFSAGVTRSHLEAGGRRDVVIGQIDAVFDLYRQLGLLLSLSHRLLLAPTCFVFP